MRTLHRWIIVACILLAGCGQPSYDTNIFTILAGSELKDLAPTMEAAAAREGIKLKFSFGGSLEMVDRVNAGEVFDAILPANGAYPALALNKSPEAREKLFYSRVALGVRQSKASALGWDKKSPTWEAIAEAAKSGQFAFAMTNPTSSNTGMSALFAVASAFAGKTEGLEVADVNQDLLRGFLSGQKVTAGSSGWLADIMINEQGILDGIVNYEAMLLRLNDRPEMREKLQIIYPKDGVISADYPLMLLNASKREPYNKLVQVWKGVAFQNEAIAAAYLRPVNPDAKMAVELPISAVVELGFPGKLEVIESVLSSYQSDLRRPATSIFVLDNSGSMAGERIEQLRRALVVLTGAEGSSLSNRLLQFQQREHVVIVPFNDRVMSPRHFNFDANQSQQQTLAEVRQFAEGLQASGGTAIYSALLVAYGIATKEAETYPGRQVSVLLLTDGDNTEGHSPRAFFSWLNGSRQSDDDRIRTFPVLFGNSSSDSMEQIANATGGKMFDGRNASLAAVFREIRGYQ